MRDGVLTFWFEQIKPKQWWTASRKLDETIRTRFGMLWQQASAGELFAWRSDAKGQLAEIILLDQFSRNIHRNTPQAFAQDGMALVLSQEARHAGALDDLDEGGRTFLLMPYMHSESALVHAQAEPLFRQYASASSYKFLLRHTAIVDRFGRYPHRNDILGRASTEDETKFLKLPGSSF
ncbi:MAG: DUF924 domain-containing protein [Salinisphaera sp.]|nr:DUF924 domain-containing protein [Salinisphaera sp.]MDN5937068.1 DUF924 domain-containing protein [Salinisphaera sp.]